MPGLTFSYNTYQDVRRNLFLYSAPILIVAGFATYRFVLPEAHQAVVFALLQQIATVEPWKSIIPIGAGIGVFGFVAFLTSVDTQNRQLIDTSKPAIN